MSGLPRPFPRDRSISVPVDLCTAGLALKPCGLPCSAGPFRAAAALTPQGGVSAALAWPRCQTRVVMEGPQH
jgi:hypothetical protein